MPPDSAPSTLNALFACERQGDAFFAESVAAGRIVHVSEVASGLACACVCPACGKPMVARKGDVRVHHFGHQAERFDPTCASAGETALHKFAKQCLESALRLALPELVVVEGGAREQVAEAHEHRFDRAELEKRTGAVVPDVVLYARDIPLAIEFAVTHPCGADKIARLRAQDCSAIEIDLSAYRGRDLADLPGIILSEAPRRWLHHRREAAIRVRLDAQRKAQAAQRAAGIARLRAHYRHPPHDNAGAGDHEVWARAHGFADGVGLDVDGAGCFLVTPAEWQARLLRLLVDGKAALETRALLAELRRVDAIDGMFDAMRNDIAEEAKAPGLRFAGPYEAVRFYLDRVAKLGLVEPAGRRSWRATGAAHARIATAIELRERPGRRRREMRVIVARLLSALPPAEREGFDFDAWLVGAFANGAHSIADALHWKEPNWIALKREIESLPQRIDAAPRKEIDLFELPLHGALRRARGR